MDEESQKYKIEEAEERNEIINLENDNPENSTEHINRPIINIEKNEININKRSEENLKMIQERINREINTQEAEELKIKNNIKENSAIKEQKKYYQNLSISNLNFHIDTNSKAFQNMDNYIYKNNNNNNKEKNKYIKYNDELKRYYFIKEFSNLHISTEENFLERMKFDIYKRQIKEQKINDFVNNNKVKIKEEKKIKTFNHLIEDANRRLKAQINSDNLNSQLGSDLTEKKETKKYNDNEWEIIYQKRFQNFLDKVNKKKIENKKYFDEEKKKKEEEIIKLIPNKKASNEHIKEISEKMYENAMKKYIKNNEKIEKLNNIKLNDFFVNNIKNEEKKLIENNNNILNNILINNKNKINKKFKCHESPSKIIKNNNNSQKIININNHYLQNKSNNRSSNYDYNLEKERQILIQMLTTKKIPNEINNNKLSKKENIYNSQKYIKTEDNNSKKVSDKIINEFFMRQLKIPLD